MSDFDPAKEAKNRAKHQISLERWVDLIVLAIVRDDRFDYWTVSPIVSCSRSAMVPNARSACAAHMPKR
jgi:uncharacterized DUF497 family protein